MHTCTRSAGCTQSNAEHPAHGVTHQLRFHSSSQCSDRDITDRLSLDHRRRLAQKGPAFRNYNEAGGAAAPRLMASRETYVAAGPLRTLCIMHVTGDLLLSRLVRRCWQANRHTKSENLKTRGNCHQRAAEKPRHGSSLLERPRILGYSYLIVETHLSPNGRKVSHKPSVYGLKVLNLVLYSRACLPCLWHHECHRTSSHQKRPCA